MSRWRECGSCTACCTVLSVDELGKPEGTPCTHLCERGCAIYRQRPESCSGFFCWWLGEGAKEVAKKMRRAGYKEIARILRDDERPDQLGVLFYLAADSGFSRATGIGMLLVRETRPGAFDEERARSVIDRVSKTRLVCLVRGEDRIFGGPPHLVATAQQYARRVGLGEVPRR